MFFDMCGLCCGTLGISFNVFFFATLLGKMCIKAPLQALFIIILIGNNFINKLTYIVNSINPNWVSYILDYRLKYRNKELKYHIQ